MKTETATAEATTPDGNGVLPAIEQMLRYPLDEWNQEIGGSFDLLCESGATDAQLLHAIGQAFNSCSSLDKRISWKGGKNPKFQMETRLQGGLIVLTGKRLLAKVREVLEIGAPGAIKSLPFPPRDDDDDVTGQGTPFPTEYSQAEIDRFETYYAAQKITENKPVKICYVREQPFVITGAVSHGRLKGWSRVIAWPVLPLENCADRNVKTYEQANDEYYQGDYSDPDHVFSYQDIKVNCGSAKRPEWWVMVGPEMAFTVAPAKKSKRPEMEVTGQGEIDVVEEDLVRVEPGALKDPFCATCGHVHVALGCGEDDCDCDWEEGETSAEMEALRERALAIWQGKRPPEDSAANGYHPQMLRMIPVELIDPSPTNPRKYFDPDKLQELASSIIEHGLIEPILVRPVGERYQLVAGERRFRAVRDYTGQTKIEAKVRDLDEKAVLEIQFVENLQRADISPIEEAEGYGRLLKEHGYTADSLAKKLGKSKSYVYARLKLNNLPPAAMDAIAQVLVPATIGELIGRLPSMEMREEFWDMHFDCIDAQDFICPSFREVQEEIDRSYTRELKQAPFSQADKKLLPEAGSCKDCPKRTGNNRQDYPDGRADVCTDVPCFNRKVDAFNAKKLAEAVKTTGARALTEEESAEWFQWNTLRSTPETKQYLDLEETCDEIPFDELEDDEPIPTYGSLIQDALPIQIVGADSYGKVHRLVDKAEAQKILEEKGIKLYDSHTQSDFAEQNARRKAEVAIRREAAGEICERVVQSLTDNPFFIDSQKGTRDTCAFLRAIAARVVVRDADVARAVAKRRGLHGDPRTTIQDALSVAEEETALNLIVEYLIAEELDWWVRSGDGSKFAICEYFGHDPRKIEKRIAKERAAEKKPTGKKMVKVGNANVPTTAKA